VVLVKVVAAKIAVVVAAAAAAAVVVVVVIMSKLDGFNPKTNIRVSIGGSMEGEVVVVVVVGVVTEIEGELVCSICKIEVSKSSSSGSSSSCCCCCCDGGIVMGRIMH